MRQQLLIEEVKALRARVAYLEGVLTENKPIGLFHTPETQYYLETWVAGQRDPAVTTAFGMTYNYIVSQANKAVAEGPPMPPNSME